MNKKLLLLIICMSTLFSDLIHPLDGSELNYIHVMFQWEESILSDGYDFELSTSDDFSSTLISTNTNASYYYDQVSIDWELTYYWRVRYSEGDWMTSSFSTSESSTTFQSDDNPLEIIEYNPTLSSGGITFFGIYTPNHSAAIDINGNEVWNSGGINSHVIFGVDENNNFLGGQYNSDYPTSLIGCEFSLNNEIVWSEEVNEGIQSGEVFTQHEIIKLPNGNYMGFVPVIEEHPVPIATIYPEQDNPFSWEDDCSIYIDYTVDYSWKGEKIVEWDNEGDVVWEWNAFDHYSINDFDYISNYWEDACPAGISYDWTHFNALAYDEVEDAIYVSSRHLSRITKIDKNSGEIIWNMGLQWYGDTVIPFDDFFSGQHGIQLLPNGNIVTLDNGKHSLLYIPDIDKRISRALEIEVSENNGVYSATTVWSYDLTDELYGALSGNVQKLDNDNYLINTIGNETGAYSIEVTQDKEVAWKCQYNLGNFTTGPFYRAIRISDFQTGCKDVSACNYNTDATVDDGSCIYIEDCAGVCGGSSELDECDVCGGDGSLCSTCLETQNNNACNPPNCDLFNDCSGECGGGKALDECGVCGGNGVDTDSDDICDNVDDCIGAYDACGICNGPGLIYECGCADSAQYYNCDSTCITDTDGDDICDENELSINEELTRVNYSINTIFPNPFNPLTHIKYELSHSAEIQFIIYNLKGEIIDVIDMGFQTPGNYIAEWNGINNPSGIYFIKFRNKAEMQSLKLILLK